MRHLPYIEMLDLACIRSTESLRAIPHRILMDMYAFASSFGGQNDTLEELLTDPLAPHHYVVTAKSFDRFLLRSQRNATLAPMDFIANSLSVFMNLDAKTQKELERKATKHLRAKDPSFLTPLFDLIANAKGGAVVTEFIRAHRIPVTAYGVAPEIYPVMPALGFFHQRSDKAAGRIDLFVEDEVWPIEDRRAHWCETISHEQRHGWQYADKTVRRLMNQINGRSPLGPLFITKMVEADASAYAARIGHNVATRLIHGKKCKNVYISPEMDVFATTAGNFHLGNSQAFTKNMALARTFNFCVTDQYEYEREKEALAIRKRPSFKYEWNALIDQIQNAEDRDSETPLGRACRDFMSAVSQTETGSYLDICPETRAGILHSMRNVPGA